MEEKILKKCIHCEEPNLVVRDGKKVQKRCICDWERGFFSRVGQTVYPEFFEPKVRTMEDWSPPIFKRNKAGAFYRLIMLQKALVVSSIYAFCYKVVKEKGEFLDFSIQESIEKGRNLFIRGPQGSGRGLLLASIKIVCAMKDISVTPVSHDFSVFRSKIIEAEAYGKEGEEARVYINSNYGLVSLLMLEDVRGEHRISFNDKSRMPIRSKAANGIDSILGRRLGKPGSVVISSPEFAGEIGDTLGDKVYDLLESDRTMLVTMFDVTEAEQLLKTLQERKDYFSAQLFKIKTSEGNDKAKSKTNKTSKTRKPMGETMSREQVIESLKEGFYFEDAFKEIPGPSGPLPNVSNIVGTSTEYPDYVVDTYREFKSEKKQKGYSYAENIKMAQMNAVRSCLSLSSKMTDREIIQTGIMMSRATDDKDEVKKAVQKAKRSLLDMGKKGKRKGKG